MQVKKKFEKKIQKKFRKEKKNLKKKVFNAIRLLFECQSPWFDIVPDSSSILISSTPHILFYPISFSFSQLVTPHMLSFVKPFETDPQY